MQMIEQWRMDVSRWGLRRSLYSRFMEQLTPWFRLYQVNLRPQDAGARSDEGTTGFAVRMANREELLRAAQDPVMDLDPTQIDDALRRGDICGAAFDRSHDHASSQERLVSYAWRSFTTAPHVDGLWVTFERPYRYGYKSLTHPHYRGRHLQDFVSCHTDALCIERGFPYALGVVETHNFASTQSNRRRRGRTVGWVGYIKLFGRVFRFRTRGARRHTLGFSLGPR